MDKKKVQSANIRKKKVKRLISFTWIFLLFFTACLAIVIAIPSLKSYGIERVIQYLKFEGEDLVTFDRIDFNWFDEIEITNVEIKDTYDSSLISARRVTVDIMLFKVLFGNEVSVERIDVDHLSLNLFRPESGEDLNLSVFINQYLRKKNPKKKPKPTYIEEVNLSNSSIFLKNYTKTPRSEGFDPNYLSITQLDGRVNYLYLSDSIYADFNDFQFQEYNSGVYIEKLESNLRLTKTKLYLDNIMLKTENSIIQDTIRMEFSAINNMKYIYDSVDFDVKLNDSKLAISDLEKITGSKMKGAKDTFHFSLDASGTIGNLYIAESEIAFGQRSAIALKARLQGLPNVSETFFDLKFAKSRIDPYDLTPYMNQAASNNVKDISPFNYRGSLIGFPYDFVSIGRFGTASGSINTDVNVKLNTDDITHSSYSGELVLDAMDLSQLIKQPFVKKTSLKGRIKGKGFTKENMQFRFDGSISSLESEHYTYSNINTSGSFASNFFNGSFSIDDPKIKMNGSGTIDFTDNAKRIIFNSSIDTVYAQELLRLKKEYFFATRLSMNLEESKDTDYQGKVVLEDLLLTNFQDSIQSDSTVITSYIDDTRSIVIKNDAFDVNIDGSFDINNLIRSAGDFAKEIILSVKHGANEIPRYYKSKKTLSRSFYANYALTIYEINDWLAVLLPETKVSPNWDVVGTFSASRGVTTLTSAASPQYLKLNKRQLVNPSLDLYLSKPFSNNGVIGEISLSADSLNLNMENLGIRLRWEDSVISAKTYFEQASSASIIDLRSTIAIDEMSDSIFYTLEPSSKIYILDEYWFPSETNQLKAAKGYLSLEDFLFSNESQTITIQGVLSSSLQDELKIDFQDLDMSTLALLSKHSISGKSTGRIKLKVLNDNLLAESDFKIDSLVYDSLYFGDITSKSQWFTETRQMSIDLNSKLNGIETFTLTGNIRPYQKEPLFLKASFNEFSIAPLQRIFYQQTSYLTGKAKGVVAIEGKMNEPKLSGDLLITNGKTELRYFKTPYGFVGFVKLAPNEIILEEIYLEDAYLNQAEVTGSLKHNNFKNIVSDVRINTSNFQISNTTYQDNEIYYGSIFAAGNVRFSGPVENLFIDAKAKTMKGTKLYIPVEESTNGITEDFISFVNLSDTTLKTVVDSTNNNIKGINMSLAIEVTPDAYGEIIFDIKSGDIIRGSGNGNLNLNLDTRGEFSMFGDLILNRGGYNFTLQNIINKEFNIMPGSKISWHGDPYRATLDIDASYRQLTSLRSIITDLDNEEIENFPELNTKYPAFVNLNLTEQMLSPKIKFSISIEDYPQNATINGKSLQTYVNIFQNNLLSDEQELNRQVFSLIILKKLAEQQNLSFEGTLNNSVSELISNQISYWVNQIDDNLEVDVDLNSLDADALNTLQLRLAYTLLDGRLKISRDGNVADSREFIDEETGENTAEVSTLIGNIAVEYLLTKDGRLRAKMYSRQSSNNYLYDLDQRNETGFSLRYTQSFDRFFGFLDRIISGKKKEHNP